MADKSIYPRGGHGGTVEIVDGTGTAEGGNGGRGGGPGCGQGGDGGSAKLVGNGYIRGGDGGDAGRPGRPALGAASPLCYIDSSGLSLSGVTDLYGIPQPGKGGDSRTAYVVHDGYRYCFNILLRLINGPVPREFDKPEIIDKIDEIVAQRGIKLDQIWWDLAVKEFPEETAQVMSHMRMCEAKYKANHENGGQP